MTILPPATLSALSAMPDRVEHLVRLVSPECLVWEPDSWEGIPGEPFSVLGQICHLRDIEVDGYHVRIRRMLEEDHPSLVSLDGDALARERRYHDADLASSVAAFAKARATTIEWVKKIDDAAFARRATFAEYGEISLLGLLQLLLSHDAQHLACLHWLLAKMSAVGTAGRFTAPAPAGRGDAGTSKTPAPSDAGVVWANTAGAPVRELFPGVRLRPLWSEKPASAQIVEIDPGCSWQTLDVHHPGPEEVYVVSGVFNDGVRDYPAGSFIHNPAGSAHVPQSATGCVLFVFYPAG